ncbi:MAG: response regulator [Nitrospinaceae bacterium]|nr:response regulator transcription factor [Nitrospinaceae bacterium]NIR54516.1 response regulator transcription factor [Nitrospinaceae bacterium]NIS84935.1 response regulator transcription factor [Nitrospinaceae bacterium]NIT81749.1 response regulator transcription factor [Nitrospinaceae bacterium]NIU44018.1 response regulator transcription factor [Nitrospinaceae bacterium]
MKDKSSGKIRIVIADDHAIVRRGLVQIISETSDLEVIAEAPDGHVLLKKIRELRPQVVLMDINMPEKSGWDVMIQLKTEFPKLPVVVLSISPEEDFALKFLKAGAAGYLTKSSAPEQLVQAIRKVATGGKFVSPALAEKLVFDLAGDKDQQPHETLSPREFQVMILIASGKTVSAIAGELGVSVPTVSTYRARILEKMDLKTNAQITHYAFKYKLLS